MFKVTKSTIEYENKSLRLPVDLIKQVQELADKNDTSFNQVVIQCIRYSLQNLDSNINNQ